MSYKDDSNIFKAFCDENRLKIINMLNSGEKCACVLLEELKITQPTLSHHMKILVESGLVLGRKEGKWVHYSICENQANKTKEILNNYLNTCENEGKVCKCNF